MNMGCIIPFIGVFALVGFGMLGYGLWSAYRSTQAASWPIAEGKMTHLEVQVSVADEGTSYQVRAKYAYSVNGAEYEGSRIAFGYFGSSGKESHDEIYEKLKNAKTVEVRYNPSEPAVSCLSYGLNRSVLMIVGFAIVWLAFVTGVSLMVWLGSRSDEVLLRNLLVH
jgi:hypothetical protein